MLNQFNFLTLLYFAKRSAVCLILVLTGCEADDPRHYIDDGVALFEQGQMESARVQFQNALQLNPKLADAYFRLALIDEQKQEWGPMLGHLLETVTIDPKHLNAQIKLGQIYLLGGQFDLALKQVKIALQLSSENPTAQLLLSSIQFRQGKNLEAMQGAEQVLASHPFLPDAIGLKANILAAEARTKEAIDVLNVGIEHNPDDPDLSLLKIRLQIETKDFNAAVNEYKGLIANQPDNVGLRSSLAMLLTEMGRLDEAELTIQQAIDKYPASTGLKIKLIDLIERRNVERTEQLLKDFIGKSPKEVLLKFRLADFYLVHHHITESEGILQDIVKAHDNNPQDVLMAKDKLAKLALQQNNSAKVERLVEDILSIDANHSDALLLRAGIRLNKNEVDSAISDLRILLRDRPNSEQAIILLAQANLLKGQMEVAESLWRKVIDINPKNMSAVISLVSEFSRRGEYLRAEEIALKAIKANPDDLAPAELLVQLKLSRKDWQGGRTAIEQLKKIPQSTLAAKYWEGYAAALHGQYSDAIKAYQGALVVQPDHLQTLLAMAQLYQQQGDMGNAEIVWRQILKNHPGQFNALQLLTAHLIEKRAWDEAEIIIENAIKFDPGNWQFLDQQIQIRLTQKDWQGAQQSIDALQKLPQTELSAKKWAANLAALQGQYEAAIQLYKEVLNQNPDNPDALLALAQAYRQQGDLKQFIVYLKALIQKSPNVDEAYQILAMVYATDKNWAEAEKWLKEKLARKPDDVQVYLLLAGIYINQGKAAETERTYLSGIAASKDNLRLKIGLAKFYVTHKEFAKSIAEYDEILKQFPENDEAANNLANLLVTFRADDKQSLSRAVALVERFENSPNPAIQDTYGWVCLKSGKIKQALPILKNAAQALPQDGSVHYHLAAAYQQKGDKGNAVIELEKSLSIAANQDDFFEIEQAKALLKQLQ